MKKLNLKRIFAVTLAMLTIGTATSISLCSCSGDNGKTTETPVVTEEKISLVSVETPYGELKYEAEDEKKMIVNQEEKEDFYLVEFKTKIDGKEVNLFDIQYGKGKGDYMGKIKKGDKNVDVYLYSYEFTDLDIDEKKMDEIYAIHENINHVITSINDNPNFSE